MTYVLEQITPKDQEKIIDDAACDSVKKNELTYAGKDPRDFPKNWVVDRERNVYMYLAPVLTRPESMGTLLYFFLQGVLYEVRIETPFGSAVSITNPPPYPLLAMLQEEIKSAFALFGRSGGGPKDCLGNPDSFSPEFGQGK